MPGLTTRAIFSSFVIAISAASLIVSDASACGRHNNRQRHQDDQGGNGGHHRNHGNDADDNDSGGGHAGYRHHHRWHEGDTGPDVTIGVGEGGRYGVTGGLIGPPTRACAESQAAQGELNRLKNLRNAVESGNKVIVPNMAGEGQSVVKTSRLRREAANDALSGGGAAGMANSEAAIESLRRASLEMLDRQIDEVSARLEQLKAECR